jgi:hypothetical protein
LNLLSPLRPNYMLYNAALRQDDNDAIYQTLKKAGNMFANTIHALVSAVLKLQRKSDVPTGLVLYRYPTAVYVLCSRVLLSCIAPDTLPAAVFSLFYLLSCMRLALRVCIKVMLTRVVCGQGVGACCVAGRVL